MPPFAWLTQKFLQIKARKNDDKQLLPIFKGAVFFSEATWSSNLIFDLSIGSLGAQNFGCEAYFQEKCCYFGVGLQVGDKYCLQI